ncbi:hypothetical protein IC582_025214 [Cucumis melo]|uniref:Pentatricopeptide repeat-containing protein At2g15980 n=2 Tax=Cucumis melo TaxID=3656 RepID=A0A1S3CAB5_CUCME|nr:pentatricopeptide repeat-containing protein At2g15980 [Cucumis melo]XP_050935348.1 pentatricopeptide repeat-containing protein At2g15980 [Cucumis melo]XP_050935349.1 pentatricopeptide repeat-containing protein At2g15980 [Cucumis melo]KAA0045943.1 pentatricopeptide repeat-containing protein [Cucumis melo var. makuwa]
MSGPLLKRTLRPIGNSTVNLQFSSSFFSSSPPAEPSPSTKPSISTVVSVLTHQRSKSRWRFLNSLCPNGFDPGEFSDIVLQIKNNPHLALRFFLWTQNKSLCNHNLISYSTLIHILARGRLRTHAKDVIQTAIRAAELEDSDNYSESERFSSSRPLKLFETLVKTYKRCGSAPFVFDLLIKALLDSKKLDSSIEIVRMLRSRGISPQVSTLNSLILLVSKCQGANVAYAIFTEVFGLDCEIEKEHVKLKGRVSPNVHTFNTLMDCFYQDGFVGRVKEIWDQLADSNSIPNSYSYSILMAVLCEEKRMGEAEELWEEMKMKKLELDVVAYNTIIGGFCKAGNTQRAEEFYREMELSGIESTFSTLEHLINGYCDTGDVDSALLVYKDMRRKRFSLNASTLEGLIEVLCAERRLLEALDVFGFAVEDSSFCPTMETFEVLINWLCQEGKIEGAFKLQAQMVGKGFKPNLKIYQSFIDAYMKEGNAEMVEKLGKEMHEIQLS